jgi:hypothetical protein
MLLALAMAGCGPTEADPRIATPQDTVRTVLQATHLDDLQAVLPVGRFGRGREDRPERPLPDVEALALCFWDFDRDDPASRGMADFVAGMLAAGGGTLRYDVGRRRATVQAGVREVVMRRSRQGWHIVLAETVPPEIQRGLLSGPRPGPRRRDEP